MINNQIRNGQFVCSICDEAKDKMWGNVCNACREKRRLNEQLIAGRYPGLCASCVTNAINAKSCFVCEVNALRVELQRVTEALKFYADDGNYDYHSVLWNSEHKLDRGAIARNALAAITPPLKES